MLAGIAVQNCVVRSAASTGDDVSIQFIDALLGDLSMLLFAERKSVVVKSIRRVQAAVV